MWYRYRGPATHMGGNILKPIPPGGVTLLDAEEAAGLLGVSESRVQFLRERQLLHTMSTPLGPRFREDELLDLQPAIIPVDIHRGKLRPGEAARILGVTVPTLRAVAGDGLLVRDEEGMYDADEVRVLHRKRAGRKTLRLPGRVLSNGA